MKKTKTNALRLLDQQGIAYQTLAYDGQHGQISGEEIARQNHLEAGKVYKTLVCTEGRECYVALIPVNEQLDLKKFAKAIGIKHLEMLPLKMLLEKTGYLHGGCSPIGMKKQFRTCVDASMLMHERVYISAGKIGLQVELGVQDLIQCIHATAGDLVV